VNGLDVHAVPESEGEASDAVRSQHLLDFLTLEIAERGGGAWCRHAGGSGAMEWTLASGAADEAVVASCGTTAAGSVK
jgi:hypothetical protein